MPAKIVVCVWCREDFDALVGVSERCPCGAPSIHPRNGRPYLVFPACPSAARVVSRRSFFLTMLSVFPACPGAVCVCCCDDLSYRNIGNPLGDISVSATTLSVGDAACRGAAHYTRDFMSGWTDGRTDGWTDGWAFTWMVGG